MTIKDKNFTLSADDQKIWDEYMGVALEDVVHGEENFENLLNGDEVVFAHNEEIQEPDNIESSIEPQKQAHMNEFYSSSEMDKSSYKKLIKGQMPIENRLDLHGMNRAQAREALIRFIVSSYAQNLRCLLVITGKGKSKSTSDDWLKPSVGILKEHVPYWLEESPCKNIILKYVYAIPKDGGSGALYVYLRRNRSI